MGTLAIGMSMMLLIYAIFLYIINTYFIYENTLKKQKNKLLQKLSSIWSEITKINDKNRNKRQFNV